MARLAVLARLALQQVPELLQVAAADIPRLAVTVQELQAAQAAVVEILLRGLQAQHITQAQAVVVAVL